MMIGCRKISYGATAIGTRVGGEIVTGVFADTNLASGLSNDTSDGFTSDSGMRLRCKRVFMTTEFSSKAFSMQAVRPQVLR